MLFAMGDGNHSFATAKACWDNLKTGLSEEEKQDHPARFAMVELINVHDDSWYLNLFTGFFSRQTSTGIKAMKDYYTAARQGFDYRSFSSGRK